MKRFLFSVSLISLSLVGCNESKVLKEKVDELDRLRVRVLSQVDAIPYQREQYQVFQGYFSKAAEWALMLKDDAKAVKAFNAAIDKQDLNALCGKAFVAHAEWSRVFKNCTRNRFFLCSEEVKAYPMVIEGVFQSLSEANQIRFKEAANCQSTEKQ